MQAAAEDRGGGAAPAIEDRRAEQPVVQDEDADEESETELERLVKSRRTDQEADPGVRLVRQLRRTPGSAASSAGTARKRARSDPGAEVRAFMSVEVATDDEEETEYVYVADKDEDKAWKDFLRSQCFFAKRVLEFVIVNTSHFSNTQ